MPDQSTRAAKNRRIRQEALREQLSSQGHVQHIIDLVKKIGDEAGEIDKPMIDRYKIVIDTKLKLINKYLPDLKATEITGEGGESLSISLVNYVDALADDANTE